MLEDEPDPPVLRREVPGVSAAEEDRARLGLDQAGDRPEQERLPGPRRADDQAVLARGHAEPVELEDELAGPDPAFLTPEHRASRAGPRPGGGARGPSRRPRGGSTATATVSASPYCVKRV